ncbi:MAG: division/cell wall cluster transcriptional repressor MraZ [Alphaproteobacteria bacterium]
MALFLSRYDNKIDRKGRVSVPASFRAILASEPFGGIFAFPSLAQPAVEACGAERMEMLAASVNQLPPFSSERQAMGTAIFERSHQLPFDPEGRIVLPPALMQAAGLTEMATFVGAGDYFHIWQPEAYEARLNAAVEEATAFAPTFQWRKPEGAA